MRNRAMASVTAAILMLFVANCGDVALGLVDQQGHCKVASAFPMIISMAWSGLRAVWRSAAAMLA